MKNKLLIGLMCLGLCGTAQAQTRNELPIYEDNLERVCECVDDKGIFRADYTLTSMVSSEDTNLMITADNNPYGNGFTLNLYGGNAIKNGTKGGNININAGKGGGANGEGGKIYIRNMNRAEGYRPIMPSSPLIFVSTEYKDGQYLTHYFKLEAISKEFKISYSTDDINYKNVLKLEGQWFINLQNITLYQYYL